MKSMYAIFACALLSSASTLPITRCKAPSYDDALNLLQEICITNPQATDDTVAQEIVKRIHSGALAIDDKHLLDINPSLEELAQLDITTTRGIIHFGCLINTIFGPKVEGKLLDLSNMDICTLCPFPRFRGPISSIKRIKLQCNCISKLGAKVFIKFCNLTDVNLSKNRIDYIDPCAFDGALKLVKLTLSNNEICEIRYDTFSTDLKKLETLDLGCNAISKISQNGFSTLIGMTYLDLSRNELACIKANSFNGANSLQTLYLNDNVISSISDTAFARVLTLVDLSLANNNLTTISTTPFLPLVNLKTLDISGNKIPSDQVLAFQTELEAAIPGLVVTI